jgi:hypothetical protein
MYLKKLGQEWDWLNGFLLIFIAAFAFNQPALKLVSQGVETISEFSTS